MALTSPLRQSNADVLTLSQQTDDYLRKNQSRGSSVVPIPLLSARESAELWNTYERQIIACLRTGNDKAAQLCLERLIERFGATNERVMGLHGLYQEAVAQHEPALGRILQEYNEVLAADPVNTPVAKRRIALLRSLSRISDAIDALVELLEASPTDIEAWVELSDLYFAEGLHAQAIFCLEEVLLSIPYAWNIQARLGEILLVTAKSGAESADLKALAEAIRRFCRSIELCDDYLRGYYGLKMSTDRYLEGFQGGSSKKQVSTDDGELPLPSPDTVRSLNETATAKLAEITRSGAEKGYNSAELAAAKDLLDRTRQPLTR